MDVEAEVPGDHDGGLRRHHAGLPAGADLCGPVPPDAIRPTLWRIFWIFGRLFGAIRFDFTGSRRHGWLAAGRVRPRFALRDLGVIRGPFSNEAGLFLPI